MLESTENLHIVEGLVAEIRTSGGRLRGVRLADGREECYDDPAGFAQRHAPGLTKVAGEHFRRVRYFATGVVGAWAIRDSYPEGRVRVPLRIEPRGIVEPFAWLVEQLKV